MYLIEIQLNVWTETEDAIWFTNLTEAEIADYQKRFCYMEPAELRTFLRDTFQVTFYRKDKTDNRKLHEFFSTRLGLNINRIMEVNHVQ